MPERRHSVTGLPEIDADEVDRRLADGWTLPATLYTDSAVARLEDELVWRTAWHVVGTLADFRKPGDFLTDFVGGKYPVVVVRGEDDELRAFLNVCRHRGALVVGGKMGDTPAGVTGSCSRFQCQYHGWSYDLHGNLVGAPNFKEGNLPPFDELGLYEVALDTWAGAVFVSIDPEEPLLPFLGEVPAIAEQQHYAYPFLDEEVEFASAFQYDAEANWKANQENNLECYHCSTTHRESLAPLYKVDSQNWCSVSFKNGNYISAPFADDLEQKIEPDAAAALQEIVRIRNERPIQYYWFWPTNMIGTGVGLGDTINRINPVDVNRSRYAGRVYARPAEAELAARVAEFTNEVILEDAAISGAVQIGLRSGAREWGPLLDVREESIKWFSAQVWSHLGDAFRG